MLPRKFACKQLFCCKPPTIVSSTDFSLFLILFFSGKYFPASAALSWCRPAGGDDDGPGLPGMVPGRSGLVGGQDGRVPVPVLLMKSLS